MASQQADGEPPTPQLEAATVTPIAELGPHLIDTAARSTRGVITIVWPYSIVNKSLSFVLAEPDFRLRRQKGQVRVTFVGRGAKAVADASLGGGDEVLLSLDGVEWAEGDAPGAPGTTLEWQARFSSGALLRADGPQSKEPKLIRVDPADESAPDAEPLLPLPLEQPIESPSIESRPIRPATPEPLLPAKRRIQDDLDADEYTSPAFVKRARVSYGSLFEGGFDPFNENSEPPRSRKRTKFGRDSSAWRYASESKSPEPEEVQAPEEPSLPAEVSSGEAPKEAAPRESSRAPMTDEACQTSDAAPSPTPSSKRHEERPQVHERSPAISAVAQTEERISSPIHHQDVTVSHDDRDNLGGLPHETIPDGLNQVHIAEAEHVHTEHGSLTAFQEQTIHPPGDLGIGSPFGGFAGEPIPWGAPVPYPAFPPPHGLPMDSFIPHQQASHHPDLSQPFAPPFQHHMPEPLPPTFGGHETTERPAEPQTQQQEPYMISSDVESTRGDTADGGHPADAEGEQQPMRLEEDIKPLIPDQRTKDEWADAVKDNAGPPGPEMTSRVDEDMDVEEAESFPSDDGDEGGDYDTRNYRDLQDDDDASDVDEDHEDYGEMDAEIYDPDEEDYDQEGEYGDESGAEDEQGEYEWEGAAEDEAPPAPAAPVFVNLISDSEDEDQDQGEAGRQGDEGPVGEQEDTHEQLDASGGEEQAGEEHEYGYGEEETHSDEDSEDGARSQEGSEEELEEEDDRSRSPRSSQRTTLSSKYDGADNIPSRAFAAVDQDENEGAEDVDMVSKPSPVVILSSPPPEEPTSPVAAQAAERPAPTQSPQAQPPTGADQHEPGTGPGPSEPVEVAVTDGLQEDGAQATVTREPTPSPDTREPSAQEMATGTDVQMTSPAAEPLITQLALSPSDKGAREPTPSPDTEAVEQSTQGIAAGTDIQMVSPAPETTPTPQPAVLPSNKAPLPTQEAKETGEAEAEPTEPVRELLDDEVQADIERQMEDSLVMESEAREIDGQLPDESKAVKGTSAAPGAEALASPPLTQAAQSQADAEGTTHEEVITATGHAETDHLPTPSATQLASASQSFEEPITTVEQGHPTEASETTLGPATMKPEVPQAKATPARARRGTTSPATESSQTTERATHVAPPGSAEGFAITVKSLRSRRHRSASAEKKDASRRDPSTRLARDSLAARERSSTKWDPSAQLARGSLAARHGAPDGTPPAGRTTRSKTRSIRMSATPEPPPRSPELGDADEPEKESQGILKLQLNKNLRLTLLDLTALKVLRSSVNRKVDVLGVATAQPPSPQRPKHGPRDYLLQLTLTDQTTAPNGVVAVQVFRPHIESLPVVREGDVLLLRRFTVTGLRGRDFGLRSCEESSWAVWERDGDGVPQIKGPPPEASGDEAAQAGLLLRWYAGLDGRAREKLGSASARMGQG